MRASSSAVKRWSVKPDAQIIIFVNAPTLYRDFDSFKLTAFV